MEESLMLTHSNSHRPYFPVWHRNEVQNEVGPPDQTIGLWKFTTWKRWTRVLRWKASFVIKARSRNGKLGRVRLRALPFEVTSNIFKVAVFNVFGSLKPSENYQCFLHHKALKPKQSKIFLSFICSWQAPVRARSSPNLRKQEEKKLFFC